MPGSPRDDAQWEKVWREADDEFLTESVPELLMQAVQRLVPVRSASGEDLRFLLRALNGLISAVTLAGREIVKLSGQKEGTLLEMMRQRLKEAQHAAERLREEK
jgi:hypothetical protein